MSENSSSDESKLRCSEADDAAKSSSETAEFATGRRLKRVAPSQKESRLSRLSRARRTATGSVKHPRDLLGVSLADGRYVVKSPLGKGSMAYVFRASDARLQTDVVLKVPKPEKVNTADFRERFLRESQMLIRFSHPHVVKVVDVGEYAELPYVVMQLLEGGSLADRIAKESDENGCMPPRFLKTWVREVARALDFCYRKGMVHRDVKPANILFDEDQNAYVGDFGLSKIMCGEHSEMSSDETAAGVVLGTPNYISPEIVQGKDYDGRSDQYSLGITIYHVLTGGPPMQGSTATMTMLNQTQKVLPLLSDVRNDIPRPLAVAVRKSIEKDPDRRFNTCEEFAEAVIEGLRFAPVILTSSHSSSLMNSASSSSHELQTPKKTAQSPKKASSQSTATSAVRRERKASDSQRSAKKKQGAKSKSSRGASGSSVSSRSSGRRGKLTSSSSSLKANLDWFDVDSSGAHSSSRMSSSSQSSSKNSGRRRTRSTKPADPQLIRVFNLQLPPVALVGLAVCTVLCVLLSIWSPFASDQTTKPNYAALEKNSPKVKPKNSPTTRPNRPSRRPNRGKTTSPKKVSPDDSKKRQSPTVVEIPSDPVTNENNQQRNPVSEFLASQHSSPLFGLPADTQTRFGDGTSQVFVSGRSVRSRKTSRELAVLSGDYKAQGHAVLSHDGKWFAATMTNRLDRDYRVKVWNTTTGKIQFEVRGDGHRALKNLFLSKKHLYLEVDRTQVLQAWNLTSRRQQGVLKLPAERRRSQRMGVTRSGGAFVALVGDQFSVIDVASGAVKMEFDSPLPSPVRVALADSSVPLSQGSSVKVLQSLSGIQFSNDQLQVAAIRATPESGLMTWNEQGHLQYDLPFAVSAKVCQPASVQWFDQRSAWLVNGSVIDAKHRRVVVSVAHSDQQNAMVALQDDDHVLTTTRKDVGNVYRRRIPWKLIDDSLTALSHDQSSLLKPGASVRISIDVAGADSVWKPLLKKAIEQRLAVEEIGVDPEAPLQFQLTNQLSPQSNKQATVLQLINTQTGDLIWDGMVGESLVAQSSNLQTQRLIVEALAKRISSLPIPYYVPSDSRRLALPYFIHE